VTNGIPDYSPDPPTRPGSRCAGGAANALMVTRHLAAKTMKKTMQKLWEHELMNTFQYEGRKAIFRACSIQRCRVTTLPLFFLTTREFLRKDRAFVSTSPPVR
jgi:hypothetical protein